MNLRESLTRIDPSKACLIFLAERVLSNNYRGKQLSQHNRYDVLIIQTLCKEFYNLVGNSYMSIRTTDLSKRFFNYPDEILYANYVNAVSSKIGRSTQDSVRKNLFVDMHRMGLIQRYNSHFFPLEPFERGMVKYVKLTNLGIQFANTNDIFERNLIYTKCIDKLTNGLAEELLDIVSISNSITEEEFMYFISFVDCELNGKRYTRSDIVDFLIEYRGLSKYNKIAIDSILKEYCDPKNFSGDKTNKRDYHNWKNETQQILMLMDQTVYFEKSNYDNKLYIRVGQNALFDDESKLKRSLTEKEEYFKQHNISRKKGFELHHVVPLLLAKDRNEFSVLDSWKNMVYIDGYTHSKISQTNNKNIEMTFDGDDIVLKAPADIVEDVFCTKETNVVYNVKKKETMKEYNDSLLHSI